MWMGADPLAAVRQLGGAVYHVRAKDTRVERAVAAIDGVLDARAPNRVSERAWNYVTLGYGHDVLWRKQFCLELQRAGYDDLLSIEHEDMAMTPLEGVPKSVRWPQDAAFNVMA
jgi:sugar phosphate isomerase/epimerase